MSIITREKAKELLPILKAYSEGKIIQHKGGVSGTWVDSDEYAFQDETENYRIKPEETYRPFKTQEECWQEMQKHQPFGWVIYKVNNNYTNIVRVTKVGIVLSVVTSSNDGWYFKDIIRDYTFADGQPFGIKEINEED